MYYYVESTALDDAEMFGTVNEVRSKVLQESCFRLVVLLIIQQSCAWKHTEAFPLLLLWLLQKSCDLVCTKRKLVAPLLLDTPDCSLVEKSGGFALELKQADGRDLASCLSEPSYPLEIRMLKVLTI